MNPPASSVNVLLNNTQSNVRLMTSLRRALVDRREVVEVGDFKFRFQKRGEDFEDDGMQMRALYSGLFAKFPVTSGREVVDGRWIHLGSTDDMDILMEPYLPKTEKERDMLQVGLGFNAALKAVAKEGRDPIRRRPTPFEM